jgi:hypothetical protein
MLGVEAVDNMLFGAPELTLNHPSIVNARRSDEPRYSPPPGRALPPEPRRRRGGKEGEGPGEAAAEEGKRRRTEGGEEAGERQPRTAEGQGKP